jgi:hypothetical protein
MCACQEPLRTAAPGLPLGAPPPLPLVRARDGDLATIFFGRWTTPFPTAVVALGLSVIGGLPLTSMSSRKYGAFFFHGVNGRRFRNGDI